MAFNVAVLSVLLFCGLSYTIAEEVKCHLSGYFCGPNCKTLFRCIDHGFGDLELDTLLNCGDNQFCNIDTLSCSAMPDHCSPVQQIECHDVGRFPSPYNCSVYFDCFANQFPAIHKCPDGQIFNPCNGLCGTGKCTSVPVPVCNGILQSGAVPVAEKKYYVCNKNLYPEQYSCNGTIFDGSTKTCTNTISTCTAQKII